MADVTRNYTVQYVVSASNALSLNAHLAASFGAVHKAATEADTSVTAVGKNATGITNTANRAKNLADKLQQVKEAAQGAGPAVEGIGAGAETAGASMGQMGASMGAVSLAFRAIHVGVSILSEVNEQAERLRDYWKDLAEKAEKFRDIQRELGNLKGEPGATNKILAETLDFSLQTGIDPEKADKALKAYENVGPALRHKDTFGKDKAEAAKLEKEVVIEVGRSAQRMGIEPDAAMNLLGTVGLGGPIKSKQDAMNKIGGALAGIKEGKLSYTGGVEALNTAMSKLTSIGESEGDSAKPSRLGTTQDRAAIEAGQYLGAISLGTSAKAPQTAAMKMVQISRAINKVDADTQITLAQMGVKPGMTDQQKLIAMRHYMDDKKVVDRKQWLQTHGIGTEAQADALNIGMNVAPTMERMLKAAETKDFGKEEIESNASYYATDKGAQNAQSRVANKVREIARGEQQEALNRDTQAEMKKMDEWYHKSWSKTFNEYSYGVLGENQTTMAQTQVINRLHKEAKKAGLQKEIAKRFPKVMDIVGKPTDEGTAAQQLAGDPEQMAEFHDFVINRLREKGIDVGTAGPNVADAQRQVDAMRKRDSTLPAVRRAAPAPAPGGAAAPKPVQAAPAGGAPQAGPQASNGDGTAQALRELITLQAENNRIVGANANRAIPGADDDVFGYRGGGSV